MANYDFDKPYVDQAAIPLYLCTDRDAARRYGLKVKAAKFANIEYKVRHARFSVTNNMKPPPRCGRIFPGYLVIRKLDSPDQYETWMPDHAFEECHRPA